MATDTGFGKVKIFNDFLGPAVDETNDWTVGTENSGTEAISIAIDGLYRITTGATSGNREAVTQTLQWQASDGGPLIGEFRVKSVTAITTRAYFIGFTDVVASTTLENPIEMSGTTLTTTASDAVGFMYDTDSTNDTWYCVGVKADADAVSVDTGVAPAAAGTFQTLRVVVDIDGNADFFIDGKWEGRVANAVTAGTDLTPIVLVETRTSGASIIDVDYIYLEKGRTS